MSHESLENLFKNGLDVKKRRVFLHGDIDLSSEDNSIDKVVKSLLYLDQTHEKPIELWINSPGGSVFEMLGLYDVIQILDNEVETVGFGEVCSAACLLLSCGTRRYATSNCFFMSHLHEIEVSGDLFTAEQAIEADKRLHDRWTTLMAKHTKHSKKWWLELHEDKTREFWLDAKQMLRHGIIDEIWE